MTLAGKLKVTRLCLLYSSDVLSVASKKSSITVYFDDVTMSFCAFIYNYCWLSKVIFLKNRHFTAYNQFMKVFCVSIVIVFFFLLIVFIVFFAI